MKIAALFPLKCTDLPSQRAYDVEPMSMLCNYAASTSVRRHFDVITMRIQFLSMLNWKKYVPVPYDLLLATYPHVPVGLINV